MGNRVQLSLVFHNHQPVGNFDHVIHDACDKAYLPFLRLAAEHPHVRFGLHTSGCLWEWLEGHRPEYGVLVGELVQRGQVELLGGGMYEPILPVLPERDGIWQLNRLSGFLEQRFGARPIGMWCPERVWEPHLPAMLAQAGLRYTLLDDHHFRSSALPADIKTEYFTTSHAGHQIALYPISKKLRYTMPFQAVTDTFAYLREVMLEAEGTPLVVFGDDGEKFGVWPDTYEWVYEKGWLNDFFTALKDNSDWVELLLPGEILERRRPAGDVFLPCSSYTEMGVWSRVDPNAAENDPPGFWRNYFHKYPESYAMHCYGLELSERLEALRAHGVPEEKLAGAADDLGRSQCNCSYWHGVFGGLYLNYLRQAVHFHQLLAERTLLRLEQGHAITRELPVAPQTETTLCNSQLAIRINPSHGLCVSRIDDLATVFCWSDVLARRLEAYHSKLTEVQPDADAAEHASIHDRVVVKEEGLQSRLLVDPHQRVNFNCYFSTPVSLANLVELPTGNEEAPQRTFDDYTVGARNTEIADQKYAGIVDHTSFKLQKTIQLDLNQIHCTAQLIEGMPPSEEVDFVMEFNLTVLTDQAADRYITSDGESFPIAGVHSFPGDASLVLVDGWRRKQVTLACAQAQRIVVYPVYTVSSSEGGFERTYQGSCILVCCHPMALLNGIQCELTFEDLRADVV